MQAEPDNFAEIIAYFSFEPAVERMGERVATRMNYLLSIYLVYVNKYMHLFIYKSLSLYTRFIICPNASPKSSLMLLFTKTGLFTSVRNMCRP